MSSEAITRRLRLASELRDLCLSLMKAKKTHDAKIGKQKAALIQRSNEVSELDAKSTR